MRARPEWLALVIPPHEVGRGCSLFEVLGSRRGFAVSSFEQAIRVLQFFSNDLRALPSVSISGHDGIARRKPSCTSFAERRMTTRS